MKKHTLLATLTLFITHIMAAEDIHYGIGVALSNADATAIAVPMDVTLSSGTELRVEPMLGLNAIEQNNHFIVGSGIYLKKDFSNKLQAYYGGKLTLVSTHNWGTTTTYSSLGAVAGVEYFFDSQLSLGAEISGNLHVGDAAGITTASQTNIRFYF